MMRRQYVTNFLSLFIGRVSFDASSCLIRPEIQRHLLMDIKIFISFATLILVDIRRANIDNIIRVYTVVDTKG